jgi:hypothetical protein
MERFFILHRVPQRTLRTQSFEGVNEVLYCLRVMFVEFEMQLKI